MPAYPTKKLLAVYVLGSVPFVPVLKLVPGAKTLVMDSQSVAPLPYPLRGRQLPPGSKVQVVAWAHRLIEKQKLRHRAWSKRQAKGPFAPRPRKTQVITPELKRERQRRYTATYRAKVRKELEGIRSWDAPTSGKMLKHHRRRR